MTCAFAATEVFVDGVRIVSITPSPLQEGERQEVEITLEYELVSRSAGRIYIGFNTDTPKGFTLVPNVEAAVERGKGRVVLKAKVVPRYWGDLTFFQAFANLSEDPHPKTWTPLATDSVPVEIRRKE